MNYETGNRDQDHPQGKKNAKKQKAKENRKDIPI